MQLSSEILSLPSAVFFILFLIDLAAEEHLSAIKKPDSPYFPCCSVNTVPATMGYSGSKAMFVGFVLIPFIFGSWIYMRKIDKFSAFRIFYSSLK